MVTKLKWVQACIRALSPDARVGPPHLPGIECVPLELPGFGTWRSSNCMENPEGKISQCQEPTCWPRGPGNCCPIAKHREKVNPEPGPGQSSQLLQTESSPEQFSSNPVPEGARIAVAVLTMELPSPRGCAGKCQSVVALEFASAHFQTHQTDTPSQKTSPSGRNPLGRPRARCRGKRWECPILTLHPHPRARTELEMASR